MGRKKSAPQRSSAAASSSSSSSSSEYLGTYGYLASTSQEVLQQQEEKSARIAEANRMAALERQQAAAKNQQVPVADQAAARQRTTESHLVQETPKKIVTFAQDLIKESDPRPTPEIEFDIITKNHASEIFISDKDTFSTETPPPPTFATGKLRVDELSEQRKSSSTVGAPVAEEGTSVTTICYHFDPDRATIATLDDNSRQAEFLLQSFALDSSVRLEVSTLTNNPNATLPQLPFQIVSSVGASSLLELCLYQNPNSEIQKTSNTALAVEEGFLMLTLQKATTTTSSATSATSYEVELSLTKRAFEFCGPSRLSVNCRKTSKAYQKAVMLQSALAELFPKDSELLMEPVAMSRDHPEPITAKQVYDLVDNVQLKAFLKKKQAPNQGPLEIRGLLPTLRHYQEAAVRWMIQREQEVSSSRMSANSTGGDEWELAWIVINLHSRKISFLPDFKQRYLRTCQNGEPEERRKCCFLCPFMGWLAPSYTIAKAMTVGSISTNGKGQQSKETGIATGGILAESMGLGKSVEVLACILANPDLEHRPFQGSGDRPTQVSASLSSSSLSTTESINIRAVLSGETEQTVDTSKKRARPTRLFDTSSTALTTEGEVSFVSGRDDGIESDNKRIRGNVCDVETISVEDDPATSIGTPALQERWMDPEDCELGSCICGKPISLFPCAAKESIVVCGNCDEPMHLDCAVFEGERFCLRSNSEKILYRKRFSEEKNVCMVCPATFCPCCLAENALKRQDAKIRSGATVIVTPPAILNQWEREIKRHTRQPHNDGQKPLKVVVYSGIKQICKQPQQGSNFRLLHPRWLADADIVLLTFDALLQDLGHSDKNPFVAGGSAKGSLRKRKRYRVVPSPLSSVSWWRVVLDEAQRVETPTAGSAQMALKLEAKHRWAVSGTPIGRGKLDDLYGLLLFLRLTPPFTDKAWFRRCFQSDSYVGKRIKKMLESVFWRSTANFDVVRTNMGLAPQIEKKQYLQFSSVERHFYGRLLEETLVVAGDVAAIKSTKKKSNSLDMLARQLHKLRAACCHPQVGSSGIGGAIKKRVRAGASKGSVGTRVLSMEQILDRLIDDAKTKCEEALRLVVFHTNPMASISRLKVEARNNHNVSTITESDQFYLSQSCKLYQEALKFADENAAPCLAHGEMVLSGSTGFRSSQKQLRSSRVTLDWQIQAYVKENDPGHERSAGSTSLWAGLEYEGQSKKLRQIRVRPLVEIPENLKNEGTEEFSWSLRYPKDIVLQISNAAMGGEFVEILSLALPKPSEDGDFGWVEHDILSIYKSKSWRFVVKSFHPDTRTYADRQLHLTGEYAGIEIELFEPSIATDSLQRLHTLHNASVSFRELHEITNEDKNRAASPGSSQLSRLPLSVSTKEMEERAQSMEDECSHIERYHLEYARSLRAECLRRLSLSVDARRALEDDLLRLSNEKRGAGIGFWDCTWWDDVVALLEVRGAPTDKASLCEKIQEVLDNFNQERGEWFKTKKSKPFPAFYDVHGLQVALKLRLDEERSNLGHGKHNKCIQSVLDLSPNPTDREIFENRHCKVCKADWYQTGEKCRHCLIGEELKKLVPDELSKTILETIWKWAKVNRPGVRNSSTMRAIIARANKFFDAFEAAEKEANLASRLWRFHLDLLNVIDELNSCKTPMRLLQDGEDISSLTEEQRGSIVVPIDVNARYHEHAAKQAMALANLKRTKNTLAFLKSQSNEQSCNVGSSTGNNSEESSAKTCMVCLEEMYSDQAVLACGHTFHYSPCLERLKKRSGNCNVITCPLRCTARTNYDQVLIATNKRNDDGTQSRRNVKGSFGTKVTAIIADLLGVSDLGEKSVVFSMWDEMLEIMEEALVANGIKYVRATSLAHIGEVTRHFRAPDCFVLLLNVKNGAEGLTLIEANHVFMIEPLLNTGLDSQARARCHRIGQTRQTYLHRYLIKDTIEEKIDKVRIQHQEDQLEDAITDGRKCTINAGGIDGGFSSQEELMDILKL